MHSLTRDRSVGDRASSPGDQRKSPVWNTRWYMHATHIIDTVKYIHRNIYIQIINPIYSCMHVQCTVYIYIMCMNPSSTEG